ncbi:unnamed protein product [Anisakis simplex]|uniref:Uncharacterized protein n=1 Tax=Anisakis simplex TaxID=6269 RepID=A0A0M3JXE6_ANISI|nr:unnamed protein product [Anisakis simplex]
MRNNFSEQNIGRNQKILNIEAVFENRIIGFCYTFRKLSKNCDAFSELVLFINAECDLRKELQKKEIRGKGDYPTMDDVLSDWDSEKDGKKVTSQALPT